MTTKVTIPIAGSAPEMAQWLDENVGTTTFEATQPVRLIDGITEPGSSPWWREGHGWRFGWMNQDYNTWTVEFDDERHATVFLLRWS